MILFVDKDTTLFPSSSIRYRGWLYTRNVNSNTYFKSAVPLQGWRFDFSDVLRTFLVCQYGHWAEYKATDKTGLRRYLYGRIDNIVELDK